MNRRGFVPAVLGALGVGVPVVALAKNVKPKREMLGAKWIRVMENSWTSADLARWHGDFGAYLEEFWLSHGGLSTCRSCRTTGLAPGRYEFRRGEQMRYHGP